ncbi:MAG: hypothetical protein ABJG41_01435 [Cyclobacteriaceae bacterium]
MDNIDKLREDYCKEKGLSYLHIKNGEYAEYISWLEKSLIKNHSDLSDVSDQRKMLIAYETTMWESSVATTEMIEEKVDKYLSDL